MRELNYTVKKNIEIAPKTFEMILSTDEASVDFKPGQFINIKINGLFLRRPISICDWNEKEITIIYKVVGRGTEIMATYNEGMSLNILLPLGNGFDVNNSGEAPILIGGGVGVPPIYGLCKTLIKEGKTPNVVMGFNDSNEVFYVEEFKKLGVEPIITTVNGSEGVKGVVTDVLDSIPSTYFYACGPEKMLEAIDDKIDEKIGGELSFEERMGCGFGACMGCSCMTKYGSKRICKEGPVLNRNEVIW